MKSRQLVFAAGIVATMLAATQALAFGSMPSSGAQGTDSSAACKSARLSAWFERQRQLTDGDADPQKPMATPLECMHVADDGMPRQQQAASAEGQDRAAVQPRIGGRRS
jgi:hypothetical protein